MAIPASCDRETLSGRRNYAILLLLGRLGLCAGEVTALTLDDFDWHEGIVTVPGKEQRREPLPLPHEVGKALANLGDCAGMESCRSQRSLGTGASLWKMTLMKASGAACWRMTPTSKPYTIRCLNLFLEDLTVLP